MSNLYLAFLGPPKVLRGEQVMRFSTRKELALLIYLAVEGGVHLRKDLSEMFWPESDALHGRAALRITLLHLRHLLDTGVRPTPHLLVSRDTLSLDLTSEIDLDLHPIHAALLVARTATQATLTMGEEVRHTLLAQLQYATSLPQGEFLQGFSLRDAPAFDDWVRFQREYWHIYVNETFDRLSQLQFASGSLPFAIATVNRWLAFDPLHEEAYRRLMRLQFASGDRTAALNTYDTCQKLLRSGMQTEPMPETTALVRRMRTLNPPAHKDASSGLFVPSPASLLEGPLQGRTAELGTMIQTFHAAQQGQTQVLLLEGEVGIGKTRLAHEFLAWAEMEGAEVLRGQAFESGGLQPYRPLIEALRPRIERENAPDDLLSDMWLAELARLLPELGDRYPDLSAPQGDRSIARNRLFEAVARLGQSLASRALLILFIDDVQWADAASLDVLHYLARRFAESETPALLFFTLRTGEVEMQPGISEWRADMERAVKRTRLTPGPLTSEEVLHMLQALAGVEEEKQHVELERFGAWLFAETEGHPFYLMETLKILLERGVLSSWPDEKGGWRIDFTVATTNETLVRGFFPPSVREVIVARLDRLSPDAFALLVAGAILGQGIRFEQLYRVANLEEYAGLQALDEVLHSRLFFEGEYHSKETTIGHYVFAHAMIQAVVYAEAGGARRSIFHRRALAVLQEAGASAANLAYHALAASLIEPAFKWNLAAGDEAMRVLAVRDAIAFYERAKQQLNEQVQGQPLEVTLPAMEIEHLYLHLGQAYELDGEAEQAHAIYIKLLHYARESHVPEIEQAVLRRLVLLAEHRV